MSTIARSVWAKTNTLGHYNLAGKRTAKPSEKLCWLPLHQHLKDAADAAARIWDEWLPANIKTLLATQVSNETQALSGFENREEVARATLVFLAATHDIGKATPCFAVANKPLAQQMESCGLDIKADLYSMPPSRKSLKHALASHFALSDWLEEQDSTNEILPDHDDSWLGYVLGGHHGQHGTETVNSNAATDTLYGYSPAWESVRDEHIERGLYLSELDTKTLLSLTKNPPHQEAQVLYSALVVYADWLASSPDLFPLYEFAQGDIPLDESRDDNGRADAAWKTLGTIPGPWQPQLPTGSDADTLFAARFSPEKGFPARPIQQAAFETAWEADPSSLVIIEAPMGEGKTEAGLMAAEILAHRTGAGGILTAMPTQVTTDRMFDRIIDWVGNTSDTPRHPISLVHSKASYNQHLDALKLPETNIADDETAAFAHVWLTGQKSGLAHFVTATIDQLLMLALAGRNLPMRHLGVAGKVVIIDECHAYDAHMNRYLDVVLEYLGAYGVPVVMLSATLPVHTRQGFIDAYVRGQTRDAKPLESAQTALDIVPAYPAVTWFSQYGRGMRKAAPISERLEVKIGRWNEDDATLARRLERMLTRRGKPSGRALVMRNTVAGAQKTYLELRERLGDDVRLVHARYTDGDRLGRDAELSRLFGEQNASDTGRYVVVSTQVVEQSLDVDFDVLISDVAPTDVLFQRMGRVHRHRARDKYRPDSLASPLCILRHANWRVDDVLQLGDAGASSSYIYEHMLIYRAMLQFKHRRKVVLPQDISRMVHEAYLWEVEDFRPEDDPVSARYRRYLKLLTWAWLKARAEREEAVGRAEAFLISSVTERKGFTNLALFEGHLYNELGGTNEGATVRDSLLPLEAVLLEEREDGFYLMSDSPFSNRVKKMPIPVGEPIGDDDLRAAVDASTIRIPAHVANRERKGVVLLDDQRRDGWSDCFKTGVLSGKPVVALHPTDPAAYISYDHELGMLTTV